MDEFRWSDLQKEVKESLDELLANIRSDVARESHEYPDDSDTRIDFEIRQLERADEWVRHAWQIYCDTLAGLGREVSDLSPIGWSTGILDFIDHRIEPLLEKVFGVTDKDREFLRRGGITVEDLSRIAPHPLDKSTAWLKVEAAQQLTGMLKRKWKEMLPAPDVHGVTGERKTNSRLLSPYTQTHLDDLMRSFQGSQNTLGEFLTAQREEDRRKADLKAAAKTALRVGMEIARERSSAKTLANLTAPRTPEVPVVPQELSSSLTLAEIADYMGRAGWDPQKASELAAAELAVDFGNKVTSKHLRVFADVIVEAPEEDQPALHLQTVDLLARWLLRKREVVGPDDRVVVGVRSLGRAKKIAALWISDGLARRKTFEADQSENANNIQNVSQETPMHHPPGTKESLTAAPNVNAFVRRGKVWSISYDGEGCLVPHQLGLEYIARLLQNPGRPMSALAVQRGADANPDVGATAAVLEMEVSDGHLYQERSDAKAIQQYKAEAEGLADEMADAKERGNQRKYEELLERLETIREHVKVDTGHGGRRRRFSDDVEKARTSVTKAIKRATRAIRQQNNAIADYLQTNITTGAELMYRDAATSWTTR